MSIDDKLRYSVSCELIEFFLDHDKIEISFFLFKIVIKKGLQPIGFKIKKEFSCLSCKLLKQSFKIRFDDCTSYILKELNVGKYNFYSEAMQHFLEKGEIHIAEEIFMRCFRDDNSGPVMSPARQGGAYRVLFCYLVSNELFEQAKQILDMAFDKGLTIPARLWLQCESSNDPKSHN